MEAKARGDGKLSTRVETLRLGDLRLLPLNARYMRHETYAQLVDNVRGDGVLTSVPFAVREPDGVYLVLSGNHRVKAAIDALGEDAEAPVLVTDDELPDARRTAIQLSHNALVGEDDPATLAELYDSIDAIDWRRYAGLDDKVLDLLKQVKIGTLAEASLDFQTISLTMLPQETERAQRAWQIAKGGLAGTEPRWLARMEEYDRLMDALDIAGRSAGITNIASALHIVLDVFEANLDQLQALYLDAEGEPYEAKRWVPLEAVIGHNVVPAEAAAIIVRAMGKMRQRGEVTEKAMWRALELWAADYLAGA